MRRVGVLVGVALLLAGCGLPSLDDLADGGATQAADRPGATVIVIDASGTMKQDDVAPSRMAVARDAATAVFSRLPDDEWVGLLTYGTGTGNTDVEKTAGCQDVTVLAKSAALDQQQRARLQEAVGGLEGRGYTPIGLALTKAVEELPEGSGHVILISDGEDTCAPPDPCETAAELKAEHPELAISTVGFRTEESASRQLSCIASTTGGQYVAASDAEQLANRASAVADGTTRTNRPVLTTSGLGSIQLGQTVPQIRRTNPRFPALDTATPYKGRIPGENLVVIVWQDCDYVFDGDTLVGIQPRGETEAIDDIAVGSELRRTVRAIGDPLAPRDNGDGSWTAYYPADEALGYAYQLVLSGKLDKPETTITSIALCRCLPSAGPRGGSQGEIVYDPPVELRRPQDVEKLTGAPEDFKTFLRWQFEGTEDAGDPCEVLSVARVRADGFAEGTVGACGGYTAMWGRTAGGWAEISMTQDAWSCADMREHGVPQDFYRECD